MDEIEYIPIREEHCRDMARLHRSSIPTGFLSSLGEPFLAALYRAITESPAGFGLVAEEKGQFLGGITFASRLGTLYRHVVRKQGVRLSMLLGFKLLRPSVLKAVVQNLLYPSRARREQLPDTELLSVVVSEQSRGKGVGGELVRRGLQECAHRSIGQVKVLVSADNQSARRLYERCGFHMVRLTRSHGIESCIYVADMENERIEE